LQEVKQTAITAGVFVLLIGLFVFAANDWKSPWAAKPVPGADWCEAHGIELSKDEKCNPILVRGGTFTQMEREPKEGECPNTLVRIHLAPEVEKQIDLTFVTAESKPVSETIRANAETIYVPDRYSRVAPRIPGVVRQVKAAMGQEVEAGAVLCVVESSDFGQAKSDYLQAQAILGLRKKTLEREIGLAEKKISTGRDVQEAQTAKEEADLALGRAAQKLSTLGLTPGQIQSVAEGKDTSPLLEVVAPFAGAVVEAAAVPGETASPEKPVYAIANLERLWVTIDLTESDYPKVEKGQRVSFAVDGLPGKRFAGKIVAVGAEVDDRTRTIRVFADLKNGDGLLRAKMFGRAEITVKPAEPKLILPKTAVQNDGDCFLVFVSPSANAFKARKVQVGMVYEQGYEIVGGLVAGEKVVDRGSFLLKSEVMRGQMGAG
jgi:cobalt-zinc-cadmium efflux system membrane fusion protein